MKLLGSYASKVIAMNCLLFLSLIIVHELGHFAAGSALGCTANGFSFLDSFSISSVSMSCAKTVNRQLIEFGGMMATTVFGVALLASKTGRKMFFITSGMSLVFGALDFPAMSYLIVTSGMSIMSFGEYSFSMSLMGSKFNILNQDKLTM